MEKKAEIGNLAGESSENLYRLSSRALARNAGEDLSVKQYTTNVAQLRCFVYAFTFIDNVAIVSNPYDL